MVFSRSSSCGVRCALSVLLLSASATAAAGGVGDDPFVDAVEAYEPGTGAAAGYDDPAAALGPPERCTGDGVFPGVVSIMNSPWLTTEIVSIGEGGSLVLRFDTPVEDHPDNPFGVDLLIFGNAFFVDGGGGIDGIFADGGLVEVSPDNRRWATIEGVTADGLFPTQGYLDVGPFDETPGLVESDFTLPVNPAFTMTHFLGRSYAEAVKVYAGAGGGTPVDIGPSGFDQISYVRISSTRPGAAIEIDAVSDVTPRTPGDANGDGVVGVDDLLAVVIQWGPIAPGTRADFDASGLVDVDDLLLVLTNWSSDA
ncbi:MAG: hypothetical protein ACYTGC_20260 [Planctomycetota bacterium]|jgi:hypothetical protein